MINMSPDDVFEVLRYIVSFFYEITRRKPCIHKKTTLELEMVAETVFTVLRIYTPFTINVIYEIDH